MILKTQLTINLYSEDFLTFAVVIENSPTLRVLFMSMLKSKYFPGLAFKIGRTILVEYQNLF